MPILYQKWIFREDLQKNPSVLYAFGDNELRKGRKGQAYEMRGEPNAVGIRTKRTPSTDANAYWSDDNLINNCQMIEEDLDILRTHLSKGGIVVLPANGIGTGLAAMSARCPLTLNVLEMAMKNLGLLFK